MILGDFTVRICVLRNERYLAQRLEPFNYFMFGIAALRLGVALPELFGADLKETTILYRLIGYTNYQLQSEQSQSYGLMDCTFILYSLTLMTLMTTWIRNRALMCLWVAKGVIRVVQSFLLV